MAPTTLQPGTRVRITQTIQRRQGSWQTSVTGEVLAHAVQKIGSWFAHGPKGKLWLNRLRIRKEDGEESLLTIDDSTQVEVLNGRGGDGGPLRRS